MTDQHPSAAWDHTTDGEAGVAGAVRADAVHGGLSQRVEQAVETLRHPLSRYAAHLLGGDTARGQDVAQDVFEKLLRQPPTGLGEMTDGRLKAWLFTVCRNRALDIRRKERRMTILSPDTMPQHCAAAPGPADLAQRRDTLAAVLRQIATLPDNQQEVIRLRFHGGLTYPQIAEVTGLTASNVGYLLHHGLKTLRVQMGES